MAFTYYFHVPLIDSLINIKKMRISTRHVHKKMRWEKGECKMFLKLKNANHFANAVKY